MKKGKKLQIIHGLAGILMLCLVLSAIPTTVFAQSKSNQKYDVIIRTERDFINFMKSLDKGTTYDGKVVKLAKDIKINAKTVNDFKLVGSGKFSGLFDGGCHTISNIQSWDTYNTSYGSIFGDISSTGVVKNLYIDDFTFNNINKYIGVIAYMNEGVIENCRISNCNINAESASALLNSNLGTIKNCIVSGALTSKRTYGLAGSNGGIISNCAFVGTLNRTEADSVSGLVDYNYGTIQNCYCVLENQKMSIENKIYGVCDCNSDKGILLNCYSSDEGVEYAYREDDGTVDNVNTYSKEEMRSSAFVKRMNSKLSSGFLKWTLNSSSEYPSLVDMNEVTFKSIDSKKGYVKSNKSYAAKGQKVTLTPVMNKKYKVTSISVKTTDGKNISAKKNTKGAYVFTMPNDKVVVSTKIVKVK